MSSGESWRRLLDTSAVIKLMREQLAAPPHTCVSVITHGELRAGAIKSRDPERELQRIDSTLAGTRLLAPTAATIAVYAEIWLELELKGRRINANDLWNAALAIEHDLELHGLDQHFEHISRLRYVRV